jgi:hypothetical protein
MAFDPNKITRENILQAINKIKSQSIDLIPSTKWLVIIEDEQYPPKEIMRYAHEQMNGEKIWEHTGGENTNRFFKKLGFEVREKSLSDDPLKDIIEKYKSHITTTKLEDEIYKWQLINQYKGRPDTNAIDFGQEISSINYANLIYPVGVGVVRHIAKEKPEEYRTCFRQLFDETSELSDRISDFGGRVLNVYRTLVPEEKLSTHHDERTMATFLAYFNPDTYPLYKDSFYQKYCKLIGINARKKGKKYIHYIELLTDFISDYIEPDTELLDLVDSILPNDAYPDSQHKILAQDILYQMLDKQTLSSRNYWRVGTSDGENSYWKSMQSNNVIAIGWSDLGNLSELDIKNRNDIYNLLKNAGYTYPNNIMARKAGEIYSFYNDIQVGDVILAQDGARVLSIGIVEDEYVFVEADEFAHQKSINWKVFDPNISNSEGLRTSVTKLTDRDLINKIESILSEDSSNSHQNYTSPNMILNQILFGPPGTGKTYRTIDEAVKITAPDEYDATGHENNKEVFDRLINNRQIVFTTFHQSMSYEDFIEGIKPQSDGSDIVKYDIEDGLFKEFSRIAKANYENSKKLNIGKIPFETAFEKLKDDWYEDADMQFSLKTKGYEFTITDFTKSSIRFMKKSGGTGHTLSINTLKEIYYGTRDFKDGLRRYYDGVLNKLSEYKTSSITTDEKLKKYVFIIDEINRGNVSQIFGELITLIETDKRLGNKEALEVTLPYSKEKFGVPPNLYIIGTMNTADRSVEALDTALRRRFSFVEMPPKYNFTELQTLIEGITLREILETINSRIEKLLDKDHLIGHSYFLGVDEWEGLKAVFQNNIIPLLQEYFFGDYGKIGLILGSGFFDNSGKPMANVEFAKFDNYNGGDFEQREIYRLKDVSKMDQETFTHAIKTLLNRTIEQE